MRSSPPQTRSLTVALALVLVMSFAATACGDDAGGASSTPTSDCKGGPTPAAEVVAADLEFDPKSITIKRGDTVRWTFDDGKVPHNVVGKGFRSPTKRSGSCDHAFTEAGTFRYLCTLHPQMTGRVVVE